MWTENDFSQPPTQQEITDIANEYGHTFPVMADPGWTVFNQVLQSNYTPAHALLAPGMQKVGSSYPSASEIEAILPQ